MTFDKFTIKAQEVVQEAVNIAQRSGQQSIEPVHILKGVLQKAKDVATYIFQKLGVNASQIDTVVDTEIQRLPRVQGGQPYLSNDANAVLQRAQDFATKNGDEFTSVEPILLALPSMPRTLLRKPARASSTRLLVVTRRFAECFRYCLAVPRTTLY